MMFLCCFSGQMSLHMSPLRVGFGSLWACSFLVCVSHWLSKPDIGGTHLSCTRAMSWAAWYRAQIPCSLGKLTISCWLFPTADCRGYHFFPWCGHISDSPAHVIAVFLPFVVETLFIQFSDFFRENVLYVAVDYLRPWEQAYSGSSYATISPHDTYFSSSSFLNCLREVGRIMKKEDEQS